MVAGRSVSPATGAVGNCQKAAAPAEARQDFANLVGNSGSRVFPVLTLSTMAAPR
jgi:hypothetical protein